MELENDKSKWNLASDLKLLDFLKSKSNEIVNKIQNNSSTFNELTFETSVCSNKINNLITSVLILTNSRFIENRVYDEDIKEVNLNNNIHFKKNDSQSNDDQAIIEKLKVSIDCGIKFFNEKYGSSNNIEDDNQSFDRYKFLDSIYNAKNSYASRPLPFLIASDDFAKDTFVGLKVENDNPIILLNDNVSLQHSISICQNDDNVSVDSFFDSHLPHETVPIISNESLKHEAYVAERYNKNEQKSVSPNKPPLAEVMTPPLFEPSLLSDEDDIFSAAIISRSNIDNKMVEEIKSKISNANAGSNLFGASDSEDDNDDIFSNVTKKTIPSFVNAITDLNSDKITITNNKPTNKTTDDKPNNPTLNKPPLESIFSSDDEEDIDIFKVISKGTNSKMQQRVNNFLSDDSDDDLFGQLRKTENLKIGTSQDDFSISSDTTSEKEASLPKVRPEISKKVTQKQQFMSNVISELSATIKDKNGSVFDGKSQIDPLTGISDLDKDATDSYSRSNDEKEDNPTIIGQLSNTVDSNVVVSDSLNDILKHKITLNAKRKRKLPTRQNIKQKLNFSDDSDLVFSSNNLVNDQLSQIEHDKSIQKISEHSSLKNEDAEIVPNNFDDEKDDLFSISDIKKESLKATNPPTITNSPPVIKSIPAFDSSDDSDEDIFNSLQKPKLTTTFPNKTEPIALFSDSDDEDFLPSNFKPTQTKTTTTTEKLVSNKSEIKKENKPKPNQVKKSIFDDDSDEDDLFKSR